VGLIATAGLLPDLTIVLDLPAEKAAMRLARALDRMEQQGDAFHQRVRRGFLDEAARQPERIAIVSADAPIEQVQAAIRQVAARWLGRGNEQ
jgi:dTMP kinase